MLFTVSFCLSLFLLFLVFSQIFDIMPIYGVLQPGEIQQVTFSFFGHADISAEVLAVCVVEEGPAYELALKGEASLITYTLDTNEVNFGPQVDIFYSIQACMCFL